MFWTFGNHDVVKEQYQPFVKMISLPAWRSSSAFRKSSPRTAYWVCFRLSFSRSGCNTFPSLELTGPDDICLMPTFEEQAANCVWIALLLASSCWHSLSPLLLIVLLYGSRYVIPNQRQELTLLQAEYMTSVVVMQRTTKLRKCVVVDLSVRIQRVFHFLAFVFLVHV